VSLNTLYTLKQQELLFENFRQSLNLKIEHTNFSPVVCLHAEKLGYKFLVNQLDVETPNAASCLIDDGSGEFDLMFIDTDKEERKVKEKGDILKPDLLFIPKYTMAVYMKVADKLGKIVTDDTQPDALALFKQFGSDPKYLDTSKNLRRFRFDSIYT
jgi:hypothetical protein